MCAMMIPSFRQGQLLAGGFRLLLFDKAHNSLRHFTRLETPAVFLHQRRRCRRSSSTQARLFTCLRARIHRRTLLDRHQADVERLGGRPALDPTTQEPRPEPMHDPTASSQRPIRQETRLRTRRRIQRATRSARRLWHRDIVFLMDRVDAGGARGDGGANDTKIQESTAHTHRICVDPLAHCLTSVP